MKILIGIQARSGSTRLPRKAFELISGRMMLDRVVDACRLAAQTIERRRGYEASVVVVTPTGDPIVQEFRKRVLIEEGPEHDVLSRYKVAVDKHQPDYLVRVTGDCPLIPGPLIAHLAEMAPFKNYDYFSNVDDRIRTAIDGADCEIISRRLFDYAAEHAASPYDREHVTTFIRKSPPEWAKMAVAINHHDLSKIKLSVDTPEDLERVRAAFEDQFRKFQDATKIYGKEAIHRL